MRIAPEQQREGYLWANGRLGGCPVRKYIGLYSCATPRYGETIGNTLGKTAIRLQVVSEQCDIR